MAISFVGIGSGLDLEGLLTDIVAAEKAPVEARLQFKEAQTTASISALGSLRSTLVDFQSALAKLKDPATFNVKTVVSTNSSAFTATADGAADAGSHAIEVLQTARTHKLASASFSGPDAVVGQGTLTLGVGGETFDITVEAGVNDTLLGLRDAINNAADNKGLRASLLTVSDGSGGTATKLVLTANESGSAGAITVATSGDAENSDGLGLSQLEAMTETSPAQDAEITIDGFKVVSSTNSFSGAIEGVTINVLKESDDPDQPLSGQLLVGDNKSGVKGTIQGFVANYNALMTVLNKLTDYDPETRTRGLLGADASVKVIESRIREVIGMPVTGAPSDFSSLAFLGIATNRDGTLSLDDAALTKALDERYADVGTLFAGDNGVATRLDGVIKELTAVDGVFATRMETLQEQQKDIQDQREQLAMRLEKIEARYRSQFAALDILVSQLNQTGDFLTQQLEATAQIINRRK